MKAVCRRRRLRRCVLAIVVALASVGAGPGWLCGQESGELLRLHFLDVGQGDAVLIEAPAGQRVLVDAGRDGRVVEALRTLGVDTLDLLIASHNHADHIGGVADVVGAFPTRYFMDNGVPHTTLTYRRTLEALREADVPLLEPERRTIALGSASLEILPPPGDPSLGHNDNSIGVLVRFGRFRAMLAGDAEAHLWHHWLERLPEVFERVGVHKASHHGSRNGDVPAALAELRPALVVVSAGEDNPYGHPHARALERYHDVGSMVLVTAEVGAVTVSADSSGVFRVRTVRPIPSEGSPPHADPQGAGRPGHHESRSTYGGIDRVEEVGAVEVEQPSRR